MKLAAIHHVAIIVSDYEKARDFYVNKLGFAVVREVTKEHTQKEVTDYIKKVYNPANKDRQIGFQPTRKLGRTYKEDDLTYNRNLLGHADIEKVVSEEKIRQLSRSIMDVLWFSLWNKAK